MAVDVVESTRSRLSPRVIRTAAIVLGVSAVTGFLTPFGEAVLPSSISAAANSSAPWALITFASVYLSRTERWFAAGLGAASFVVMDAFFYVTFDALGGYYPHHYLTFWMVVAIAIGPLVGLCASWLRSHRRWLLEIAVAAPSAILTGEGVFMLVRLPGLSTLYALACVVGGAAVFALLAAVLLRRMTRTAVSFALYAGTSALFYAVYGLVPLILNKVVP
jgi:hypothetical protein